MNWGNLLQRSVCASLLLAVVMRGAVQPAHFEDAFAFTFIDQEFQDRFGGPPFDRTLYARVIERCRAAGAKGVLIKLFLDQERTAAGDEALARAMTGLPVILQARLEPATGLNPDIPERFAFAKAGLATGISGDRGWIPIPRFMAVAADIGFVDFADETIPLLETYRGAHYKSIVVCGLELQTGVKARLGANGRLLLGDRMFPAGHNYLQKVTRSTSPLPGFPLSALLAGQVDETLIRGRVVILGFTGKAGPKITTPTGEIEAHVFFGQCLRSVFESLNSAGR